MWLWQFCHDTDSLMQGRCSSITDTLKLRPFYMKPSILTWRRLSLGFQGYCFVVWSANCQIANISRTKLQNLNVFVSPYSCLCAIYWSQKMYSYSFSIANARNSTVAPFTKEVNRRLAKRPVVFNGRLANRGFTSLVIEATVELRFFPTNSSKICRRVSLSTLVPGCCLNGPSHTMKNTDLLTEQTLSKSNRFR